MVCVVATVQRFLSGSTVVSAFLSMGFGSCQTFFCCLEHLETFTFPFPKVSSTTVLHSCHDFYDLNQTSGAGPIRAPRQKILWNLHFHRWLFCFSLLFLPQLLFSFLLWNFVEGKRGIASMCSVSFVQQLSNYNYCNLEWTHEKFTQSNRANLLN